MPLLNDGPLTRHDRRSVRAREPSIADQPKRTRSWRLPTGDGSSHVAPVSAYARPSSPSPVSASSLPVLQQSLPRVWSARRIDAARVEGLPGSRAYHDIVLPRQVAKRAPRTQLVMHDNHAASIGPSPVVSRVRLHRPHQHGNRVQPPLAASASLSSLGPARAQSAPAYRPIAPWFKWSGGFDEE